MKNNIKTVVALSLICAVVAVLLAVGNFITAPIIEKNQSSAANESLKVVMPNGEGFETVDISNYTLPKSIGEVYKEKNGGYVFKVTTAGYSSGLVIMCGVDKGGAVTGTQTIASAETLGHEYTYGKKLLGTILEKIDGVDTIASATKTTLAYKTAVKDALVAFEIIVGGGDVDLRSEEEIFNDNLNAALPDADGKFTEVFISEKIEAISAFYKADNGAGYVAIAGEENFIAIDNNGNVISPVDDTLKAAVAIDAQKLINSTLSEIDLTKYENMPSQVLKAYSTSGGNYVFELKAAGYGINGNKWDRSDEYIYIKASATADGQIISVKTTSQKESAGVGDACADKKFYTQFNGKNESNYGEIDAISGATVTTNGYKSAISKIFEAIKIIKGVA